MSEPPRPPYGSDPDEPTRPIHSGEEPTAPLHPSRDPTAPPPPPAAVPPPAAPPGPPGIPPGAVPPPGATPPAGATPPPGAAPPSWSPPPSAHSPAGPPPTGLPPVGAPGDFPPGAQPYAAGTGLPPAPRKKKTGMIVAIILGIVLLTLCLCGAGAIYLAKRGFDQAKAKDDTSPTALASPTPAPSAAEDSFAKGDCAVNDGTDQNAKLRKVPCTAGTFEVVARVLFTTDRTKCDNAFLGAGKGRYDYTYTHNGVNPPTDSYVLCMKRR